MSILRLLLERKDPTKLKKLDKKVERTLRKGRPKLGDETAGVELYNALIDSGKSFDDAIEAIASKFGIKPATAEERLKRHGIRRPSEGEAAKRRGAVRPKLKRYSDAVRQRLFKNPDLKYRMDNGKTEKKFHKNKVMLPRLRLPEQPSIRGDTAWIGSLDATSISLQFQKLSRIKELQVVRVVVDIPRQIFADLDSKQLGHVLSACAKSLPVYERSHRPDVLVFDRMDIMNAQHKDAWTTLRDGIHSLGYKHAMVAAWDVFAKDERKLAAFKRAAGRPNITEDMQICEYEEIVVLYPLVLDEGAAERALRYAGIAAMSAGLGIGAVEGSKKILDADRKAKAEHAEKQKERGPSTRLLNKDYLKKHGVVSTKDKG